MSYKSFLYNILENNTFSPILRKFTATNMLIFILCVLFSCLSLQAQTSDTYFSNVYVKDSKTIVMESVCGLSDASAHRDDYRSKTNYSIRYTSSNTSIEISSIESSLKTITINLLNDLNLPANITLTYTKLALRSLGNPFEEEASGSFNIPTLHISQYAPGYGHNTSILAWGTNSSGQTNTNSLENVVDIATGRDVTVYLHQNGTLTNKGSSSYNSITNWENVIAVSVDYDTYSSNSDVIAALRNDGTVYVCAPNSTSIQSSLNNECVPGWENITQVVSTKDYVLGLGNDRKVKYIGNLTTGADISEWFNIQMIDGSVNFVAALTFDKKLLYHHANDAANSTTTIENVVLFSVGVGHLIYVTEDEIGNRSIYCVDNSGQPSWNLSNTDGIDPADVLAISAGNTHNLYLMNDGQVIVKGISGYSWSSLPSDFSSDSKALVVSAGRNHSVVLLDTGTISNTYSAEVDVAINEGVYWDYGIEIPEDATDLLGKNLVYTLLENDIQEDVRFNLDVGRIYWQPSESAGPGTYCVKVRAADADDLSTYFDLTINLTVNEVNLSPNIIAIDDVTIVAGTTLDLQVTAKDSDKPENVLTYSLTQAPTGMLIESTTGRIVWSPSNNNLGSHTIFVSVNDNTGNTNSTDTETFSITVTEAPIPLKITPIESLMIPELTPWISDPLEATGGSGIYEWELIDAPMGMQIIEGCLSWTPTEEQSDYSPYPVVLQVTDNDDNTDQISFIIQVLEVNEPPILDPVADQTATVGLQWTLQLSARDPDPPTGLTNRLAYSITGQPDGVLLDPSSGLLSYVPDKNSYTNSPYTITATVTDVQGATNSCNFKLTITYVNNPPIIEAAEENYVCTIRECEESNITDILGLEFIDPDGDSLTFELENNPEGMEIDIEGNILWTPTEAQGPGEYEFILTAKDNDNVSNGSTQATITVNVVEVNTAPYFPADFQTQNATIGEIFTFNAGTAKDADLPQQVLRYSKVGSTPSGAIVYSNGQIIWTPAMVGEQIITFEVADNGTPSLSATNSIKVIVAPPTQTALKFLPVSPIEISEHEQFQITLFAAAPGGVSPIRYSLENYVPGMQVDPSTGSFTWTPGEDDGNQTYSVKVIAEETESPNRRTSLIFTITVNEVNDPPIVAPISVQTVDEGETLSVDVDATDPEEQNLTYTVISIIPSDSIEDDDARFEGSTFKWTTREPHGPGAYKATIRVTDAGGVYTESTFNILVKAINDPPRFTLSQTSFDVYRGHTFVTELTAEDDDIPEEKLIFSKSNTTSATDLTLHPYTGIISWAVPMNFPLGTLDIVFYVTDSNGGTSNTTIHLTVKEWSDAPDVHSSSVADLYTILKEGEYFEMDLQTIATDGWKWEIISIPDGMVLDLESLKLTWTPGELDGGHTREAILKPTVNDAMLQSIPEEIHLTFDVLEVNSEPQIILPSISAIHLNQEIKFKVQTRDSDLPVQSVKLELLSPLPEGASYEDGVFRWRPTSLDQFNNSQFTTLHFRATDSGEPVKQTETHVLLALRESADNDESAITYSYSPSPLDAEYMSLQWNIQDGVEYTILATTSEPSAEWVAYAKICLLDDLIHIEKAINSIGSEWFVLKEADGNIVSAKNFNLVSKNIIGIDWQINPQNKLYYLPFMDDLLFPIKLSNNFITIDLEQNILKLDEYIKDTETGFVNFRIESSSKQKTNN